MPTFNKASPARRQGGRRDSVFRAINRLARRSDNCSLCQRAFSHNAKTFGGVTTKGAVALVGDCCCRLLAEQHTTGIYLKQHYGGIFRPPSNKRRSRLHSAAAIDRHISSLQKAIGSLDRVLKKGGAEGVPLALNAQEAPWKADDAAWFAAHPDRTQRARPAAAGEWPQYVSTTIVRQIAPGSRIKTGFSIPDDDLPVPDEEAMLHGLFDLAVQRARERSDAPLGREEVTAARERYLTGGRA
jgi:hypothetical protein